MIILYSSPGCASCRKAKQWLKERGMKYVEKNIFKSAQNVNITQIISYFNDDKHYHFLDTYDKEKKDE